MNAQHSLNCPCCNQPVSTPSLDIIIESCALSPMEERIFCAIWRGKGRAVLIERILDAMYADDINGGPDPEKAYRFLRVSIHKLRAKLDAVGIQIINAGTGRGYRIVIGGE